MFVKLFSSKYFPLIYLFFLSFIIFLSTIYIWNVFYWNDEWRSVADVLVFGVNAISYRGKMVSFAPYQIWELLIQGRLLGAFIFNRLIAFSMYQPYGIIFTVLFGHIVNSFLIFVIVKRATKHTMVSLAASLFFAFSSIHLENFLWIGAGFYNIWSMTAALLTIVILQNIPKKLSIFLAAFILFSAFIAYELKENCAFLLLFIPAYFFLIHTLIKRKVIWSFVIGVVLMSALGFLSYSHQSQIANMLGGFNRATVTKILFNVLYYPSANFSQLFIPYDLIMMIRTWLNIFPQDFLTPVISLFGINSNLFYFDCLSLCFSVLVLFLFYRIFQAYPSFRKIILIGLLWYVLSMSPLAVRLVARYNGYLTYSYLYHPMFSASIFFACITIYFINWMRKRVSFPVIQIGICCYFIFNIFLNYRASQSVVNFYSKSKKLVSLFQSHTTIVPKKPILFISSPMSYSLNAVSTRLPFMLGSGFILSILLYPTGTIPSEFLVERYLEPFDSQGYKEIGNKGYGFFWNFDDLVREFARNQTLSLDQVVAFEYSADGTELRDITEQTKKELQKY